MHARSRAISTLAIAMAGVGMALAPPAASPAVAADGYRPMLAVDGDTIQLPSGRSVRLLGYDTPQIGECGYDEAFARMAALVRRPVKLVHRSGTDSSGRILAYARTRDGRDIGTVILREGLGVARYDGLDGYRPHPKQRLYRSLDSSNADITCIESPPPEVPPPAPVTVHYENCDAVRAAGAAPIYEGNPGYAAHLDGDSDGIGCEEPH